MAADPRPLVPGDIAPDELLHDTEGNPWQLDDELVDGRLLLVFFRGAWCFLSRRALAALRETAEKLDDKGCRIAAISMDPVEKLVELKRRLKLPFPLLADTSGTAVSHFCVPIERRFGTPFPTVFLIGPDGRILLRHDGRTGRDWPDWEAIAKSLQPFEQIAPLVG